MYYPREGGVITTYRDRREEARERGRERESACVCVKVLCPVTVASHTIHTAAIDRKRMEKGSKTALPLELKFHTESQSWFNM